MHGDNNLFYGYLEYSPKILTDEDLEARERLSTLVMVELGIE